MVEKIILKNFKNKTNLKISKNLLDKLKKIENLKKYKFLESWKNNYKYSYKPQLIQKYKNYKNINIFGMGGSTLGSKAIYKFLHYKILFENIDTTPASPWGSWRGP